MRPILLAGLVVVLSSGIASAKATRFWNLTDNTIETFELAPTGSDKFGPDQCKNDKDGSVDHDERLKLKDVSTGTYDVRFTDSKQRTCLVKGVAIKEGDVFSIDEKQLSDCKK